MPRSSTVWTQSVTQEGGGLNLAEGRVTEGVTQHDLKGWRCPACGTANGWTSLWCGLCGAHKPEPERVPPMSDEERRREYEGAWPDETEGVTQ